MATKPKPKPEKKKNVFSVFGAADKIRARKKALDDIYKKTNVKVIGG